MGHGQQGKVLSSPVVSVSYSKEVQPVLACCAHSIGGGGVDVYEWRWCCVVLPPFYINACAWHQRYMSSVMVLQGV
ncbi:hypothetical protein HaLaN_05999 [Haematococcus lacustris]|uniref:Uncharacterized protein n=1 Tax=Haematococcus lacustris TaxID=44745 RepID=A0A699YVY8_HAELA|nr:hypothetical protein HaLaN_05999 [Haematococcus lacustris]